MYDSRKIWSKDREIKYRKLLKLSEGDQGRKETDKALEKNKQIGPLYGTPPAKFGTAKEH